jgi:hypothetical protein
MRIRIYGAGWYGCHIASDLIEDGHEVEIHEQAGQIFAGASGSIPARLHIGCHYPRSRMTRAACQEHQAEFMSRYGFLTHGVPTNIYAIADRGSLVDFDQYCASLKGEIEFLTLHEQAVAELGLQNVEGAIQVQERHILTGKARKFFEASLGESLRLHTPRESSPAGEWDWTIDCTFCSGQVSGVDRYEPCLVLMLYGDTSRAVTVMDGPFPSLYPWDESRGLCSLSSALWTPFSKTCQTYAEAAALIEGLSDEQITAQAQGMIDSMAGFYPNVRRFSVAGRMLSIRAMPHSAADTRLCDIWRNGRTIHVRAGKIDAVVHAGRRVRELIDGAEDD